MKKNVIKHWAAACLLSLMGVAELSFAAELAVIVHPANSITKLSQSELSDIYLGRSDEFANGATAEPLDQPGNNAVHSQFIKAVLGMDEGAWKSHWSKLMFSGKGEPPRVLASDEEVRAAVAANPQGIGYINRGAVNSSVKVMLIIP